MAIDISNATADAIAQARALADQLVAEARPGVDTRGVVGDLVLGLYALLGAGYKADADRLTAARSLKAIEADPEGADPDVVDAVLSNFNLSRLDAAADAGPVEVFLDAAVGPTVPAGSGFTIRGRRFVTEASYTARTDAALLLDDTDVLVSAAGGGRFSFKVPVVAEEAGAGDPVRRGDSAVPDAAPEGFLSARAAADFSGGRDAETNAAMLQRLRDGMALKAWSTRDTVSGLVAANAAAFGPVLGISVVGLGDPEMRRVVHPTMGVVTNGADVYLRSAAVPARTALVKQATYVGPAADGGGVWQVSLAKGEAAGVYEVTAVRPLDAADGPGLSVTQDLRSYDATAADTPVFEAAADAAYGAYQTVVVRFEDPGNAGPDATDYELELSSMPGVAALQAFLNAAGRRPLGGDVHVRAATPCQVFVELSVEVESADVEVDSAAVAAAACAAVNKTPFAGRVYRSAVEAAATAALPEGASVRETVLRGRVRRPDGTVAWFRASDVLAAPDEPALGVSPRTVAFCADGQDAVVQVSVTGA